MVPLYQTMGYKHALLCISVYVTDIYAAYLYCIAVNSTQLYRVRMYQAMYSSFLVQARVIYYRFSAVVEEILQEVCLVEFTSSVCTICLLEYYCIVVR